MAKAPMEWKISTPEEQAAAEALVRSAINRFIRINDLRRIR